MSKAFDITIRRARLRGQSAGLAEIGIRDGRVVTVATHLDGEAATEIDAACNLVTESFVNPHLHLCKVWTLPMMEEEALKAYQTDGMARAMAGIELAAKIKEKYAEPWIIENARRAVALAALHGNLHIRAFADVDSKARLEGVRALIRLRDEFRGVVDIQVVAFAQDGIVREPGAAALMREAMACGADVVGGIPWIEFTEADAVAHVRTCFDLACEFGKDVSMLLDDAGDPTLRTLEMMASEAIRRGWQGRALAHHCRAMSLYPMPYVQRLGRLLEMARVPVVTDPHTGPLHVRVKELLEERVLVCLGQDDISDAYYPFGRNNMLEVAFLASHLLWMTTRRDIEKLYDMITVDGAKAINLVGFGIVPGGIANLVVLDCPDVVEALRYHAPPRHVISSGKIVDQAHMRMLAGLL
ncbi:MAG TPA: amidohydrolase family protein [Xanthobacteraceae bacterium]|nr:amidohydrolase family protein [Xanthobacteraceae bacterium]